MSRASKWADEWAPKSLRDLSVRTAKTTVAAFAAFVLKSGVHGGVDFYVAALNAAWVAGAAVVLNGALSWANS